MAPRRSARPGWLCLVCLLSLVVLLAVTAYKAVRLRPYAAALTTRAKAFQSLAGGAAGLTKADRLAWLGDELGRTAADLRTIRAEVWPLLWLAERLGRSFPAPDTGAA